MKPIAYRQFESIDVCEQTLRLKPLPEWQETGLISLEEARREVEEGRAVMPTKRTTQEVGGKVVVTEQLLYRRTNAG